MHFEQGAIGRGRPLVLELALAIGKKKQWTALGKFCQVF
jgi:hypothetical protein